MEPRFCPATPAGIVLAVTVPLIRQFSMTPVFSFAPTRPPVEVRASTVPVKEQSLMVPALLPAMPPAYCAEPPGFTSPETFSSFTTAPSCT